MPSPAPLCFGEWDKNAAAGEFWGMVRGDKSVMRPEMDTSSPTTPMLFFLEIFDR